MSRVLVVDDDPTVREVVQTYLTRELLEVSTAATAAEAVRTASRNVPNVAVLDVTLADGSGFELGRTLRRDTGCAVMLLSANHDRALALQSGADDFLLKPFSPRELTLRVTAVLRPRPARQEHSLRAGPLQIDTHTRRCLLHGVEVDLTNREFDLLAHLMGRAGVVVSRAELMNDVYGWTFHEPATVTADIRHLREKIETDFTRPALVVTVWGVGYCLDTARCAPAATVAGMP